MFRPSRFSSCAKSIVGLGLVALLAAGGSASGEETYRRPRIPTALLVGEASGPIYEELTHSYRIERGSGQESAAGYKVLIYDGNSIPPDQIDDLPATINFLSAGKILILLHPTQDDRQALVHQLGATALVDDSPAVAVFNTFSRSGLLEEVDMVEFPETLNEDGMQTIPPGPSGDSQSPDLAVPAQPDDETLQEQTRQWRANQQQLHGRRRVE